MSKVIQKKEMDSEIISLLRKRREGLSLQKIIRELHLSPSQKTVLRKRLERLRTKGMILRLKRKYYLPFKANLIRGRFIPSSRGFGFVSPVEGLAEDIFIPARYCEGARRGDVVEVLYRKKGREGKPEGRVISIVKREAETLIGLFKERWGNPYFLPFDSSEEIPLALERNRSLQPGMIIEVDRDTMRLYQVLGLPDDPGVDSQVIIKKYRLSSSFPKEVLAEAENLSFKLTSQEKEGRKDYRDWITVTIDGENAQDFDDAVSIKKLRDGDFLLGVHIADVSHYVQPDSRLDEEAFRRGSSVYFPDLTLPMLPEILSNNICSLRPKEEKLSFSVLLHINRDGHVVEADFHPSLIQTEERMTYASVYKIFQEDKKERQMFSLLVPDLLLMRELAQLLRKRRRDAGSLDFDLLEPELIYKEGSLHSVVPIVPNEAHQVIEEFMLAANEAVACYLSQKNVPMIYRIHPSPSVKGLERLREIVAHFNLFLPPPKKIGSKDLQRVLKEVEGRFEEKFVSLQVLKSMKLAVYSAENFGHYGLAKKVYTHFTSPIRRYPDLVVHRLLKSILRKEKVGGSSLSSVALHCSQQERLAEEAERELLEWRIYRFLKRKLGEEMEGTIVDIVRAGLVVELDDYLVDGLVSFTDLAGDYYLRRSEKTLVGRRTGKTYELGDRLRVNLVSVNPIARRLGLTLSAIRKE